MINKSLSIESVPLQALWQKTWHKNYQKPKEKVALPNR